MDPDERTFREHIASSRFCVGVTDGRWRINGDIEWPECIVAVRAAPRPNSPSEFFFRIDLTNYPQDAPIFIPWNLSATRPLSEMERPKGHFVGFLFRHGWGHESLYAPFDRIAIPGHSPEARSTWNPSRDLAWALDQIYDYLNNVDYEGV